jgi:hypothetical protein
MEIMAATAIPEYLYLLDEAFQDLLNNLCSVTPDDWSWVPAGGHRTICDIVRHVGGCKFMYHNHAFGDAELTWDDPLVDGVGALATVSGAIEWLKQGQERLRQTIASLDDAELPRPRRTNWGEWKETRWIIAVMIQHDQYHAGEINHIRALHQQNDRWAYDDLPVD